MRQSRIRSQRSKCSQCTGTARHDFKYPKLSVTNLLSIHKQREHLWKTCHCKVTKAPSISARSLVCSNPGTWPRATTIPDEALTAPSRHAMIPVAGVKSSPISKNVLQSRIRIGSRFERHCHVRDVQKRMF